MVIAPRLWKKTSGAGFLMMENNRLANFSKRGDRAPCQVRERTYGGHTCLNFYRDDCRDKLTGDRRGEDARHQRFKINDERIELLLRVGLEKRF